MKIATLIFRFRIPLYAMTYLFGYLAPWDHWLHLDNGRTSWLWLAGVLSRTGWLSFNAATIALLLVAITLSLGAAALRTWAYASSNLPGISDESNIAAVAFRPPRAFSIGTMLHTLALALLMPPSGAGLVISLIGTFQLLLDAKQTNAPNPCIRKRSICSPEALPLFTPAAWARASKRVSKSLGVQSLMGEIYMWGVAVSFLAFGWGYNAVAITQGVVISSGVSLLVRALLPQ